MKLAALVVGVLVSSCASVPVAPSSSSPAQGAQGYPGDAPLLDKGAPAPFPCVCLTDPKARAWYAAPLKCQAELESFKLTNAAVISAVIGVALALMVAAFEVGREVK